MHTLSALEVIRLVSFAFILVGSLLFGYWAQPIEMGLSIVAGAIALAFSHIDKIQKFKGAGFEAEMRAQVETMAAKQTEPPKVIEKPFLEIRAFGVDVETKEIIKAFGSEKYTWRNIAGVAEETQLSKQRVQEAIDWLMGNGLATAHADRHGRVWALSPEGYDLLRNILATEKAQVSA